MSSFSGPARQPGPRSEARVRLDHTRWVAHRGWASRYPENTRLALERAVEIGARYLEFDVHLSADRVPVLIHDRDLQRTAGRPERVADLTAAELGAVSVHEPARLGERYLGEPVPRLAAIAEWLSAWPDRRSPVHSFVEIKRKSLAVWGVEEVVARVLDAVRPIEDRSTILSFDLAAVELARSLGARSIGWVVDRWGESSRAEAERVAPEHLFVNFEKVPAGVELWPGGWTWTVYEVLTRVRGAELIARGADLLETMAVGELLDVGEEEAVEGEEP